MDSVLDPKLIFSALSFAFTGYFWLVKARKERPDLRFHQLSHFRHSSRRHPTKEGWRRHGFQQLDTGGVLAVNHSTRQNSIILFDCFLMTEREIVRGDWGYSGEDKPPWNLGPETTIAFSPAFFFDLPDGVALPEEPEFHAHFITASGVTFTHRFTLEAPQRRSSEPPIARAA